jgi:hypothetical protein
MTPRRRRLLAVSVAGLLVLGAGALWLFVGARPSPYNGAYGKIRLGMTRAEVDALLPEPNAFDQARASGHVRWFDWEGMVNGEPRRVQTGDADGVPADAFFRSANRLPRRNDGDNLVAILDRQTGKTLARQKKWVSRADDLMITIVFDPDGRVIEKTYFQMAFESRPLDELRERLKWLWPF